MNKITIKNKRASSLKLASMSEHWSHMPPTKSGKHRSQEMQRIKKKKKRIAALNTKTE